MLEQKYSGKPFSVVVARVQDDGFGRVEIISPKEVMCVELLSRSMIKCLQKFEVSEFLKGESKVFEHIFQAQAVFNLDRSGTKIMTIENHQYPVLTVLKVIMDFNAKVTLQKNDQGNLQIIETCIQDIDLDNSSFNVDIIGTDEYNPKKQAFFYKQLQDHDIHSPIDENVLMKKEVLLKIFNSLDLQPFITGVVLKNHKWN